VIEITSNYERFRITDQMRIRDIVTVIRFSVGFSRDIRDFHSVVLFIFSADQPFIFDQRAWTKSETSKLKTYEG